MKKKCAGKLTSRRQFFKGIGAATLSSVLLRTPLLGGGLLWARSAVAQTVPKRVVFVYVPDGAIPEEWHARGSETDFTLPAMSEPLTAVKNQCIFLNGIEMNNAGHGRTSKAIAGDRNTSLDLFLGKTLGAVTPFSSLQIGVISNGHGSLSRLNGGEPPYEDNPFNVFDRLFGAGNASVEDISTRRRRSVLDTNLQALNQFRSRLGNFEKARLDEHASAIERIEARLTSAPSGSGGVCTNPVFNSDGFNGDTTRDVNFEAISNLQMDLIALAFKCDLTRVVSIMLGNHQSDFVIPESDVDTNYHQSIHGRPAADYVQYRRYFSERVLYLLQTLAATADVDGSSLLDNTIVAQVTDMGDGRAHAGSNVPFMLAGGGGGALRRGRALSFGGADYRNVLDTVAVAAGIDIENPEYPRYGNGPLSGVLS